MVRSREVQERFSDVFRIDQKRVTEVTARIRPHGFFATETKSKLSHGGVTARHCACLTLALLGDTPVNQAPDFLKEALRWKHYLSIIQTAESHNRLFNNKMRRVHVAENIIDGLEVIFELGFEDKEKFKLFWCSTEEEQHGLIEVTSNKKAQIYMPLGRAGKVISGNEGLGIFSGREWVCRHESELEKDVSEWHGDIQPLNRLQFRDDTYDFGCGMQKTTFVSFSEIAQIVDLFP